MKKIVFRIICIVLVFASSGCGVSQYSSVQRISPIDSYRYFYVVPTGQLNSGSGFITGGQYGVGGISSNEGIDPSLIIIGYMQKRGYIRLTEIDQKKAVIISYGESGRHLVGLLDAIEITLQFIDASTNEVVLTSTAAASGWTKADYIRKATLRCLDNVFKDK